MSVKCFCHLVLPDGTKVAVKDREARSIADGNTELIVELTERLGDIETALDEIIVIQNDLIGGASS